MSSGTQPNFNSFINSAWGWGNDCSGLPPWFGAASNMVVGTNPPYTITDFLSFYPKYGGTPLQVINCTLVQGSQNVVMPAPVPGIAAGQFLTGIGIPSGAFVQSYTQNQTNFTLSLPATESASSVTLNIYNAPFVPVVVIMAYIALASASIMQARWFEMWPVAMALYCDHFCTLYARSQSGTFTTAAQAAMAGIQRGITISKGAGPVSQGIQPITGLEDWSSWTETESGTQLATLAKIVGMGPSLLI